MDSAAEIDKIARKLRDRELILFVGSGMSAGCYPTWSKLLEELIHEHLEDDAAAQGEAEQMLAAGQHLDAAWVIGDRAGDLTAKLADKFRPRACDDVAARYRLLDGLSFRKQ